MDTSRSPNSPALVPVCDELRSRFGASANAPMPLDLSRLLEALDDAYASGVLFPNGPKAVRG